VLEGGILRERIVAGPITMSDETELVLQRLVDSLQVLVLLLPLVEREPGPRGLLVTAAAKQALDDAAEFRTRFLEPNRNVAGPSVTQA
jgi:hypothetical protein